MADNEFTRCVCCGEIVERELIGKRGECRYCKEEASGRANYSACLPRIPNRRVPYAGPQSNSPYGAMLERASVGNPR